MRPKHILENLKMPKVLNYRNKIIQLYMKCPLLSVWMCVLWRRWQNFAKKCYLFSKHVNKKKTKSWEVLAVYVKQHLIKGEN